VCVNKTLSKFWFNYTGRNVKPTSLLE